MKNAKPFDRNQPLEGNWILLQNPTDDDAMKEMLDLRERLVADYPDGIPGYLLQEIVFKSKKVHE